MQLSREKILEDRALKRYATKEKDSLRCWTEIRELIYNHTYNARCHQ